MKYLSLFSGIGGFEIGIENAWKNISQGEEKNTPDYGRNKSISQGPQDQNNTGNNRSTTYTQNTDRTLLQDRQEQGDTITGDMAEPKTDTQTGQPIRQTGDRVLREGDGIRNEQESIRRPGNMSNTQGRDNQPTCIGYSEIDPYADAIYKYNFGGTNCGDVTKINPNELPDFDLLVGGFPCQAFSIAGKRKGFEDTRGTLIYDVLRILKEKQPRHFILENVKGLLSHDSGNTFKTIITSLTELGYAVEWQVLNAKNFGVPQNRERVFIVGHLGGFGGRQVFPIRGTNETDTKPGQELPEQISNTLRTNYSKGYSNETYVLGGEEPDYNDPDVIEDYWKEGEWPGYNDTEPRIRRLTPTECERLMGYPDDWTKCGLYDEVKEMSDTRRYKACGNGVVSSVVEEVVRRLYD